MASLTLPAVYRSLLNACARSPLVTGVELLLFEEPVLKLRAHLGSSVFIAVFFNVETMKTSFALIKEDQRIFGADNTRGWHLHPFGSAESHFVCEAISFKDFLDQVEKAKDQ